MSCKGRNSKVCTRCVTKVGSLAAAFILITIIDEFKLDLSEHLTNKNSRKFYSIKQVGSEAD